MAEIVSVFLALIVVIALMIAVIYLMKWLLGKISGSAVTGDGTKCGLKMISCISVGQEKSVAVIRAGEKYLLIGITAGGITNLCELDENDIGLINCRTSPEDMQGRSFAECLKYNIRKMGGEFIAPKNDAEDNKKDS